MTKELIYDLFVSYADADHDWVEGYLLLALGLPKEQMITHKQFRLGEPKTEEFHRAVLTSRYTVLVLSPAYLTDEWSIFSEQLLSHISVLDQRTRMIPLQLRPCNPRLPIRFRIGLDCTDKTHWEQEILRLRTLLDLPSPEHELLPCPYPGMVPYSEENFDFFFGRESEVDELKRRLRHQHCIYVIGPSGSGKSSLISAGLIPELRKRQRNEWLVKSMRPGNNPLQTLAKELDNSAILTAHTIEECTEVVTSVLGEQGVAQKLLLVIDQFEELFAQTSRAGQSSFIALLKVLRQVKACTLLFAMRADFYPDLMNSALWPVASGERLEVVPLRGEHLRNAITKPAKKLDVYVEVSLLERLFSDTAGEPGLLPLLQETMVLLWEKMERRLLTLGSYEEMGKGKLNGLAVALSTKADATLAQLTESQRTITRRILLRLVQFGEGREDTRRQQTISALISRDDDPVIFEQTLHFLTDNRLLTLSGKEGNVDRNVDIAHEALIAGWPTLQRWLTEHREAEQTRRRLEAKVAEWVRLGKGNGALLDTIELLEAERWSASPDATDLGDSTELPALIQASRERYLQEELRWKELYARAKLDSEEAERQRKIALAGKLTALAELIRSQQPHMLERSVLLALEAQQRLSTPESDQILRRGLSLLRRSIAVLHHEDVVKVVTFGPDGRFVATASDDQTARLWHVTTGQQSLRLLHDAPVRAIVFSPDKRSIATASDDQTARIWDATTGYQLTSLMFEDTVRAIVFSPDSQYIAVASDDGNVGIWGKSSEKLMEFPKHDNIVNTLAFSPNSRYLAIASWDYGVRIWEIAKREQIAELPHENIVLATVFTPDSNYLATASGDGIARVWNIRDTAPTAIFKHEDCVNTVAFSPDGRYLATASLDHTACVWEVLDGHLVARVSHANGVNVAIFSPDGMSLATASDDHTAGLWEVTTGYPLARLSHNKGVKAIAFSPDGMYLATASEDHTARVWETNNDRNLIHGGFVHSVAFSPDGMYLATASEDHTARVWEVHSGRQHIQIVHQDVVHAVVFSPDGHYVVTGSLDHTAKVWEVRSNRQIAEIAHEGAVSANAIAISPQSDYVATASWDGTVGIWEITSGKQLARLPHKDLATAVAFNPTGSHIGTASWDCTANIWEVDSWRLSVQLSHGDKVNSISFSPDGYRIVTASADHTAVIWDVVTGQSMLTLMHADTVNTAIFSPDGRYIITASDDYTVGVWEAVTGHLVCKLIHEKIVYAAIPSPDSSYVVTASDDGTAGLWEITTGSELARLTHRDYVYRVAFSPDGRYIATASKDGTARLWLWKLDDLIVEACSRLTRNLTREEWQRYMGSEPYRSTCPNLHF